MKKNKGETLVESLISLFFVTVAVVPISNLFLKTIRSDVKVDDKNKRNVEIENMIEMLKSKKYGEIQSLAGKYEISGINDFYNKFKIDEKYRILENRNDENSKNKKANQSENKTNIEIKATNGYFVNESGEKEYIFEINADKFKDYYFPNFTSE